MSNTWKHIRRSPYQAMAAILTVFFTALVAGISILVIYGLTSVLSYFESKPQITVFFSDKATADDAKSLEKVLQDTGKVAQTVYISKDDALKRYKDQNKKDPLLLEMVTADILPASLEVSTMDPKYLADMLPIIKAVPNIEEVVYQKDVVDALLSWTRAIRVVSGIVGILLAVNAFLTIMTVITMKIGMRKDEVEILTLVGASPWYIRRPFVMEGVLYGCIGATLGWMVISGALVWSRPYLNSFLNTIPSLAAVLGNPIGQPLLLVVTALYVSMVGVGMFLGLIGSLSAVSRYLKFA